VDLVVHQDVIEAFSAHRSWLRRNVDQRCPSLAGPRNRAS
jgi:hypothetical protein